MSDVNVPDRARGFGRLGTAAAWISAAACLPYLALKVAWTLGMPVGIADPSLLDDPGWVAGNALMGVIQLAGLLLVLGLTRPWARRVPAWLLLFPVWMATGMLFQVVVGAVLLGLFSPMSKATSEGAGGIEPWVYAVVYSAFAVQGVALALAFGCHVRARWGRLLGECTGDIDASGDRVMAWRDGHVAVMAQAVAGVAVVVVAVFAYWAGGGSLGLSGVETNASWPLQVSRGAGAAVAVVGLLGLAGRWGYQTRFWLPVALTWVGSGALFAFDGFTLVINKLFLVFGADTSEPGWSLFDTALVIKALIGVSAAVVGAMAVTAATREAKRPRAPRRHAARPLHVTPQRPL